MVASGGASARAARFDAATRATGLGRAAASAHAGHASVLRGRRRWSLLVGWAAAATAACWVLLPAHLLLGSHGTTPIVLPSLMRLSARPGAPGPMPGRTSGYGLPQPQAPPQQPHPHPDEFAAFS